MSWAVTTYRCNRCDFEVGDLRTWGSREYVMLSGVRIPMQWTLGWCFDCSSICAVELLDAPARQRELDHAVMNQRVHASRLAPMCDEQSIANWNYLAGLVADAQDSLSVVTDRTGPIRCLICGSLRVAPWQTEAAEDMRPLHVPCSGPMRASEDGFRIALIPTITRYTTEGEFIEQIEVPGYTKPAWEYFADRSEENDRIRGLWTSTQPNIESTPMAGWASF